MARDIESNSCVVFFISDVKCLLMAIINISNVMLADGHNMVVGAF